MVAPGIKNLPCGTWYEKVVGGLCDLPNFCCPYHLARERLQWLRASSVFLYDVDPPLFRTNNGTHPPKESVVDTFEARGATMGQPAISDAGLRLFDGHTPHVTGGQVFTAMGVEIHKVRDLARRSG